MRYGSRPEHIPGGDPCKLCGLPADRHRQRKRARGAYYRQYNRGPDKTIAIDGEGVTLPDGSHVYVYLAASDADRDLGAIEDPAGLSTKAIFDFLLELPRTRLKVGYGLGYDKTLWVRDMPDPAIWLLARPELRMRRLGRRRTTRPVQWEGYLVDALHKRFSLKRESDETSCIVWDFLGFFQRTFVRSLTDWEVGTKAELAQIQAMKDQRGEFATLTKEEVQAYCRAECRLMAQLADKLIAAHDDAGLTLRSYYGAGSTASVLLDKYDAKEEKASIPPAMVKPVQQAFFGGRFEISRTGPVQGAVYQYDIASAYPWAMSRLPCFKHGDWRHHSEPTQSSLEGAAAALVNYRLPSLTHKAVRYVTSSYGPGMSCPDPWGPLPFRRDDGNIIYPAYGGTGWVWGAEFLSAQRFTPSIQCLGAWLYHTDCDCGCPFAGFESEFRKRIEWGKSGKGQVLKLGLNSCYGKRAQRSGSATYRCMISAGMITSATRARLLDAIQSIEDRSQILSVATDGLLSLSPLPLDCPETKQLGAWEASMMKVGVFMIRPGFEFSLNLTDEKSVKARGAGKKVVLDRRKQIVDAWEGAPGEPFSFAERVLFRGWKTSITRDTKGRYKRKDYGRWLPVPLEVSYAPMPKRPFVDSDWNLHTWVIDDCDESSPYDGLATSDLAEGLRHLGVIEDEQPDSISGEV